jgi:Flp pilus assembly protein TadG
MKKLRQTGSQIIEFALVLPIMVLILLFGIEAGILVFDKAVMTHVSRDAARRAALLTAVAWDPAVIEQDACDAVRDLLITFSSLKPNSTCSGAAGPTVSVTPTEAPGFGASITVSMAFPMTGVFWNFANQLSPSDPAHDPVTLLTASTSMAHE